MRGDLEDIPETFGTTLLIIQCGVEEVISEQEPSRCEASCACTWMAH